MKKLNNKGFAITGILYTLFILFILTIFSVLNGLQTKKNVLEESTLKLETSYQGEDVTGDSSVGVSPSIKSGKALVSGKYTFRFYINDNSDIICYSYLNKGDSLDKENITYIPTDCNKYKKVESNNLGKIRIELESIYSFEGK